ncbi:hypothetical protein KUTeg_010390 [Tegillarca granosa]|uniref:Hedgehog N-terminal signalling domain-containing protein n=1 Tax=Tegillarca granosa TaxID=220873 RepID=A0ABQ9FAZ5_TEGGR|nr:hypothetical protein KUTeg_010390 [Tegillarca granosa]
MELKITWRIIYLWLCFVTIYGETITFDTTPIEIVDPVTLGADASNFQDPKDTGSYLLKSTNELDQATLSLNIQIQNFRSVSSVYFRAHPVFISCIQNVITSLRKQNLKVQIVSAYKTAIESGTGIQIVDDYAKSGCGIRLKYQNGVSGDLLDIAKAALKVCPEKFEKIQRDIGIVLLTDSVHIHMTGRSDPVPYFSVSGYSGITNAAFQTLAITQINEGLDSFTSPNCSLYNGIDSGGVYPPGAVSIDAVVGALDEPITRSLTEDFKKLVQYIGTNIDFTDSESSAAWCGEVGIACVDCKAKYVGNGLNKRCADRLMSARMYNVIKPLQKLVRENIIGDKLKVLESWDEPYDGKPNGDSPNSLHMEGRAITLQLSVTNTPNNLKLVSKLAVCAGADYVAHNNDHLTIAVKKMSGYEEQSVKFPKTELIAVDPPSNKKSEYSLPVVFTSEDANEFPLFDSDNKGELILADNATVRMFMSDEEGIRYFRLSPRIVQCYSALVYHENKRNKENDPDINIEVIRGYVSNSEQAGLFEDSDKRYNTHTLGVAMQIKYSAGSPDSHTPARLAQRVIDKCSPIFNEDDERVGIGLYSNSIFVDIRSPDDDLIWVEKNELIPGGMTLEQYSDHMYKRAELAIQNRIIDPDDFDEACNLAIVPMIQSFDYTYKLPEVVLRKRKRRAASNKCVPKSDTDFCLATTKHREAEVNEIWKEMNRKHLYAKDMRTALEGCFGACGTCLEDISKRSVTDEDNTKEKLLMNRINYAFSHMEL